MAGTQENLLVWDALLPAWYAASWVGRCGACTWGLRDFATPPPPIWFDVPAGRCGMSGDGRTDG